MNASPLALVEPRQIRFRENHPAEQVVDKGGAPALHTGQPINAQVVQMFVMIGSGGRGLNRGRVRGTGQVEPAQLADAVITVAVEGDVHKRAQVSADLPQLVREVEDSRPTLRVTLLMHAHDDLAVQATQEFFELGAQDRCVGPALVFTQRGAKHLIAFFTAQLVEKGVETEQLIGLAQHQIHRHIRVQLLMDVLQPRTHQACQCFHRLSGALHQVLHLNSDQHPVQGAVATTLPQQAEQSLPAAAIHLGIRLGHVAPGGVDQDAVIGKVPVAQWGALGVTGQFALQRVDRKFQPRVRQQTGFTAALGADQQVPRQIIAPTFAAPTIDAGGFKRVEGVLEALSERLALLLGLLGLTQPFLTVGTVL